MAKARREMYANRARHRATFGADASAVAYVSWETGMNLGQNNPMKWVILGATVQPLDSTFPADAASNGGSYRAQLQIGENTDMIDADDPQLISQCGFVTDISTNGGLAVVFPVVFPVLSPIPTFCNQMTFCMQSANLGAYNSTAWILEVTYVWAPIDQDEIVEYLAAFGQL